MSDTLSYWAKQEAEGRPVEKRSEMEKETETEKLVVRHNQVDHPPHYGGEDNPYEVIKVIEAWELDFHLGTAVKYIPRAGKKDPDKEIEDLKKSIWYLKRKIGRLENGRG